MNEERLKKFLDWVNIWGEDMFCPIENCGEEISNVPWCCEEVCTNDNLCLKKWLMGETE